MPPRARKATAARAREPLPDLRDVVAAALKEATWLKPSDGVLVAQAKQLAAEIEAAAERAAEFEALKIKLADDGAALKRLEKLEAMCNVTKVRGWLGPQLQGVMRDLGCTPSARAAMKADSKPVGGRLAHFRARSGTSRQDDA